MMRWKNLIEASKIYYEARCPCPSYGLCKHILGACVVVRDHREKCSEDIDLAKKKGNCYIVLCVQRLNP